jgi:hypothetical protein
MHGRTCLLVLSLCLASGSVSAGAQSQAAPPSNAPKQSPRLEEFDPTPRFLWGMGEWPLQSLEAERHAFGFRLEFDFGSDRAPRPAPRLR